MAEEWRILGDLANGLTVVAVLVIVIYVLVSGKVTTRQHLDDVAKGLEERNADLAGERDRAVTREETARRELAENNAVLSRLETTMRDALSALTRRR